MKTTLYFASAMLLNGCATMFNPQPQSVHISAIEGGRSVPVLARIEGRESLSVQLPAIVHLTPKGGRSTTVTVQDPCFQSSPQSLQQTVVPSTLLNVANYFVGGIVDYATGAMWEFDSPVQIPLTRIAAANCPPATDGSPSAAMAIPTSATSSRRPRRHRLHAGLNFPMIYAEDGKGMGTTLGGGGGVGYEYQFGSQFSMMARLHGASFQKYDGENWRDGSIGGLGIFLNHHFERAPSLYAGLGLAARSLNIDYYRYTTGVDPYGYRITNTEISTISNEMGHAMLNIGWRSSVLGSLYIGADMQITSPSLMFHNVRYSDDLARLTEAQRRELEQLRKKMLHANQFNLFIGLAF